MRRKQTQKYWVGILGWYRTKLYKEILNSMLRWWWAQRQDSAGICLFPHKPWVQSANCLQWQQTSTTHTPLSFSDFWKHNEVLPLPNSETLWRLPFQLWMSDAGQMESNQLCDWAYCSFEKRSHWAHHLYSNLGGHFFFLLSSGPCRNTCLVS